MKNVMFQQTPIPGIPKGAFDLSYESKFSGKIGWLMPFMWYDIVPGDKFQIKSEVLVKFSPMLTPTMHRIDVFTHYFFVPYRLLMQMQGDEDYGDWKAFITGDPEGNFNNLELPYVTISNANKAYFAEGTLADYLGLPVIDAGTTVTQDVDINVLPFFAYHLIYDEMYRDENLIDRITAGVGTGGAIWDISLCGGDHNAEIADICRISPRLRAYEKDYFKGALPTAYAGTSADVELDLDLSGKVGMSVSSVGQIDPAAAGAGFPGGSPYMEDDLGGVPQDLYYTERDGFSKPDAGVAILEAQELWRMEAIAKWLMAERRGGIRYNEMLRGIWGINPDNAELDYPQYIGGGRQPVQIQSIMNQSQVLDPTAGVNDGAGGAVVTVDPQSLETGKGLSYGKNYAGGYFKEHGIIMGIVSVLPRTQYGGAQIEKFWRKADREEFFNPHLQHLGDQAVLQSEVGYDATGTDKDNVYGYQVPWAEYKFKNSSVHGAFLSTLDDWHMAEIGDTSGAGPDLVQAYIECSPGEDANTRVFADQTGEHTLYFEIYNDVRAIRPILVHDNPRG